MSGTIRFKNRTGWASYFSHDPVAPLCRPQNGTAAIFARRELLGEPGTDIGAVWMGPEVARIIRIQRPDGSFGPGKGNAAQRRTTGLLETWRQLRFLVDQYGMTNEHEAVRKASEYVFTTQSDDGDFRGILANQYAPYYTGALLCLLVKAGYARDSRVEKGIRWLLKMRQDDGGWVIGSPGMVNMRYKEVVRLISGWTANPAAEFDFSKPFSAAGTGMAIRALSVHPDYRRSEAALKAAGLLKSKLLRKDNWSSYGHPDNWVRFQYPFWWTNLVSALDSISLIGIPPNDADVSRGLEWLVDHQQKDGLWNESYSSIHRAPAGAKSRAVRPWISLAICRIFKRYFGETE